MLSMFVNNQKKRRNKRLLGELSDFPEGTMAIGRLDEHSEGLLFLTTDGMTSEEVRSKKVEKEYYVQVDGEITASAVDALGSGVTINVKGESYQTLKCPVRSIDPPDLPERAKKIRDERHGPTSWVSITLSEGKFRQVRKMTAAVGFPTLRLIRVRIGIILLGDMKPEEVLEVDQLEVTRIYSSRG
ncbi:MAG: 23S rRNA pseudouridine2457 synthase [Granulosicoccus sp.]|jgi:23S rRNA pseudouridine2457 synthase